MGLVVKMYANEAPGEKFPPKVSYVVAGGNCYVPNPNSIYPEYLTDVSVLICPSDPEAKDVLEPGNPGNWVRDDGTLDINPPDGHGRFAAQGDASYLYMGYVIKDNAWLEDWTDYGALLLSLAPMALKPDEEYTMDHPVLGVLPVYRFREGVERFFVTDVNNPAGSCTAQSELAVMWDCIMTVAEHFNHVPGGANVLFMDGHVSFIRYPSETFPVTETFATISAGGA